MLNRFFQVQKNETNLSLFEFLVLKIKNIEKIDYCFKNKMVYLNKKIGEKDSVLKEYCQICLFISESEKQAYFQTNTPQILHSDDNFLVINKPHGMIIESNSRHQKNNIVFFLRKELNFSQFEIEKNEPVIHRLDKPTTGLFLLARNLKEKAYFQNLMKNRQIKRKYLAIVKGHFKQKNFLVEAPLLSPGKWKKAQVSFAGRTAITYFQVLATNKKFTLLECELKTGRTHQIRRHLKFIGYPIYQDSLYGTGKTDFLFLHSYHLSFNYKNTYNLKFRLFPPNYFSQMFNIKTL